jgi:hypothetical protein
LNGRADTWGRAMRAAGRTRKVENCSCLRKSDYDLKRGAYCRRMVTARVYCRRPKVERGWNFKCPSCQNALRFPASVPWHPCCLPLTLAILLQARDGGRSHPHLRPRCMRLKGDHARVRLPSIPYFWHTGLLVTARYSMRVHT